jgi:hypothetical protein
MPIVTNTFVQNTLPDSRISYVLRMYDQEGTERLVTGLLPAGFDTAAFIQAKIVDADIQLAEDEFNTLVGL